MGACACRRAVSNRRPSPYEGNALPLSYDDVRGPGRDRTGHLPFARRTLYQMSYEPVVLVRTRSAIRTRTSAGLSGVPPANWATRA